MGQLPGHSGCSFYGVQDLRRQANLSDHLGQDTRSAQVQGDDPVFSLGLPAVSGKQINQTAYRDGVALHIIDACCWAGSKNKAGPCTSGTPMGLARSMG